jgi:hypothetical protein
MKYANTYLIGGVEIIGTVLPLGFVPGFDPQNPPQANTYAVPDDVQVGWVKSTSGLFVAPTDALAPSIPSPPLTCTPYQFKAALIQLGLYTQAQAAVAAGSQLIQLAWAESQIFVEDDSTITAMAAALGKTSADIHALFVLAKTLSP